MGIIFESFVYDFLALAATLIIASYVRIKSRMRYFSDRNIPYVKKSFFSQFTPFLKPANMTEYFKDLYDSAKDDPYSGFFMTLIPSYLIRDPQLLQKIVVENFSSFHDHGFELDDGISAVAGNLFNLRGEKWKFLRYKLAPTFTSGKLKAMLALMEESADKTIQEMKLGKYGYDDVLVKNIYLDYNINVIATCAFGIDGESISDPNCRFRKILDRFSNRTALDMLKMLFRMFLPFLADIFRVRYNSKQIDDFFIALTKETFEIRQKSGIKRNDFIQLLLELKEKGSVQLDNKDLEEDEKHILNKPKSLGQNNEELEITDELLCAQILNFWTAGYENASVSLAMTSYLLGKHKTIQERVRKEVKDMKEKHGGFNQEALKDMKLLDACISESLRLYPPILSLQRLCTKNFTLDDGNVIEKGSEVFVPLLFIHKDSRYWRDPDKFIPERFLEDKIIPGSYMPFGNGPRICIGKRFAQFQTKIMLAKLMESFEIIPNEKTKEPPVFNLMTMNVTGGLWVSINKIDQS